MAYNSVGFEPPIGMRAHSTRGMSASWALFQGVSVEEIFAAASWAMPHIFTRFYRLDVTAPNLSHSLERWIGEHACLMGLPWYFFGNTGVTISHSEILKANIKRKLKVKK